MNHYKKVAAVLCARMNSKRLPSKPLTLVNDNWSLLEQCVWRLKKAESVGTIIIATSTSSTDDDIVKFALDNNLPYYRGSLEHVVERMWDAVHTRGNGEPLIYRAMADQPYMDWEALYRSATLMLENKWDTLLPLAFETDPVYGAGVAPWSYNAFQAIRDNSTLPDELEHAGMWLRRNLSKFNYGLIDLPHWCYRPYRLELDTQDDLKMVHNLHSKAQAGFKPLRTIIRLLDKRPTLVELNSHVEEKTGTYTSYTQTEIKQWQKDYAGRPVVWSDVAGLMGSIDTAKQLKYRCPECGGALIAVSIIRGDLELECIQCNHKKKYYSAKPKK